MVWCREWSVASGIRCIHSPCSGTIVLVSFIRSCQRGCPVRFRAVLMVLESLAAFSLASCNADKKDQPPPPAETTSAVISRGDSLALPGTWTPAPGDALEHSTAGFANILCSGVFITGLEPADVAANVGWFTSPPEDRLHVTDTIIDRQHQLVRLKLPSGVWRSAKRFGSQGCVALPKDQDSVYFTPSVIIPKLPEASTPIGRWAMRSSPSRGR